MPTVELRPCRPAYPPRTPTQIKFGHRSRFGTATLGLSAPAIRSGGRAGVGMTGHVRATSTTDVIGRGALWRTQ
jgi:hypothetical protein